MDKAINESEFLVYDGNDKSSKPNKSDVYLVDKESFTKIEDEIKQKQQVETIFINGFY